MNLAELQKFKPQILAITGRYGIHDIRVFGSVVRGNSGNNSDIDLLVSAPPNLGFRFYGMADDLTEILGCSVDIVAEKYLNPLIADSVLKEAVPL